MRAQIILRLFQFCEKIEIFEENKNRLFKNLKPWRRENVFCYDKVEKIIKISDSNEKSSLTEGFETASWTYLTARRCTDVLCIVLRNLQQTISDLCGLWKGKNWLLNWVISFPKKSTEMISKCGSANKFVLDLL